MNNITNHIKKAADQVMLSETEKRDMSRVVREYMTHKPLRAPEYATVSIRWFSFSWVRQPLAAALALVFIFSGGISYAAESSLPGDALYAVKTKVNESVKVALATDTEAKAEVQMELAERRIEEAAALAAENRLDSDTQVALASAFEAHAESATKEVETIDTEDASAAAEITSRFETRLATHEAVLALVSGADATNTLASKIRTAGLAVADIRARAEERIAVSAPIAVATSLAMEAAPAAEMATTMAMKASFAPTAPEARLQEATSEEKVQANVSTGNESETSVNARAAERMRASAEFKLKTAQKKLKSSKTEGEIKAQAEAELALAADHIEEGRVFLKDNANAQAYHAFQEALVISEKMNVMLKSKTAFAKANLRAAEVRTKERTSKKIEVPREETRAATTADVGVEAMMQASATPIELEVETEVGTTIHEVVPFIPPPLKIFKTEEYDDDDGDHEEDERDSINIEL